MMNSDDTNEMRETEQEVGKKSSSELEFVAFGVFEGVLSKLVPMSREL
jgi:hypothetical protein